MVRNQLRTEHQRHQLRQQVQAQQSQLNSDQQSAVDVILQAVQQQDTGQTGWQPHSVPAGYPNSYFLDSPGGCGKTFTLDHLIAAVRSGGRIVLCVASSGIAALLLDGGRTAHSQFAIPIQIDSDSPCGIDVQSVLATLIVYAALIVWDEAPMTHRLSYEKVNKCFQDVMAARVHSSLKHRLWGGKLVVTSGDFRQVLPIVRRGTRAQVVAASLSSSNTIWHHPDHRQLQLRINMRVLRLLSRYNPEHAPVLREFAEWQLAVGDGRANADNAPVRIPDNLCMPPGATLDHLLTATFGDVTNDATARSPQALMARAILCPKSDQVNEVNDIMHDRWPGRILPPPCLRSHQEQSAHPSMLCICICASGYQLQAINCLLYFLQGSPMTTTVLTVSRMKKQ
jgi:hypothetical protein